MTTITPQPATSQPNLTAHTHVQALDGNTLLMVTVPRGTKSNEIKEIAKQWLAKKGNTTEPKRFRTAGYRNWYTPMQLERIILEVEF